MKKFLIIASTLALFTGCFGGEETSTDNATTGKKTYQGSGFSILIPEDWTVIEPKDFNANVPGDTQVGFVNNVKNETFTAALNVVKTEFQDPFASKDFYIANSSKNKSSLVGYSEISSNEKELSVGEKKVAAFVDEFEGKRSASDVVVRFKQMSLVNDKTGFTLTAAHLPNEKESVVKNLDEMIDSFTLK